ncbi:hypothetical protein [Hyphomonas sp.]|uniref:hypothetical protein n=1 Tax=Hyphomonas sp. TaxID=87 RepID=UPI003919A976
MIKRKLLAAAVLAAGCVMQAGLADSPASGDIPYETRIRCASVLLGLSAIQGEQTEAGWISARAGMMWLEGARSLRPQHEAEIDPMRDTFPGPDDGPGVIYEADEDFEADSDAFWKEAMDVFRQSGAESFTALIDSELDPCLS